MANLSWFLLLILAIEASVNSKDCKTSVDNVKDNIQKFLTDFKVCQSLRQDFKRDNSAFSNIVGRLFGSLSDIDPEQPSMSELCRTYNRPFEDITIVIKACVSGKSNVILSFSTENPDKCGLENVLKELKNHVLCDKNSPIEQFNGTTTEPTRPPTCTCPDCESTPTPLTTDSTTDNTDTAMSSTMTSDPKPAFTSGPSTFASGASSDSSSRTPIITTSSPSARTQKPSSATSQSTTLSTSSSSLTSDKSHLITERQHDAPDVGQGHSGATTAIIAVTSFIVGVLVGILCLLALYYRRTGKLCFIRTEKPTERLSSDRVTKKVLAKHLRSVRNDSPASNNVVHYESEPNIKGVDDDTEGMYTYIDQSDAGKDQQPSGENGTPNPAISKQPGTKMKIQQEYTDITFSSPTAVTPQEEHVYNHLELERQVDQTEQQRKPTNGVAKGDKSNGAVKSLRVQETTNSDVFDCGRDSSVSGHDYFVLQNENFRTSQQPEVLKEPEVKVSDGESATRSDEMSSTGDAENAYFVLKKE